MNNFSNNLNNSQPNTPDMQPHALPSTQDNVTAGQTTMHTNPNALPMQSFQNIPEQNPNACEIVAQMKSGGDVSGYQLSNGQVVDMQQAISMTKQGQIKGVGVATNQGKEYLRSLPDSDPANNLSNLPTIQ